VNIFGMVVLVALIVDYVLSQGASLLNLRRLGTEAPGELRDIYKEEDYRRSQEYTRATTRLGFLSSTGTLAVTLVFWFAGGFRFLDEMVRGWGLGLPIAGLLYVGMLLGGYSLFTLPFSIYRTFGLEKRFGFNRTTPGLFAGDLLKGVGLAVVLGAPLLVAVTVLFERAGAAAWAWVWLAVSVFSLAVQFVAPAWIMPLFNKFTPLPEGDLREAILAYTARVRFPVANLFEVDSSRRSTRSNAYFTGIGRNKRIALFDTLVRQHTTSEIVAVLAHEIGHYKKKHIIQGMVIGIAHNGIILALASVFLRSPGLYEAFKVNHPSVYAGLVFFALLYTPVELVLSVALHGWSRRHEAEADRFAVATTGDAASLVNGLKRLAKDNLTNLTPHPLYVLLNYSHPPLLARVRGIEGGGNTKHETRNTKLG
jgi:STE24 endopeptidase